MKDIRDEWSCLQCGQCKYHTFVHESNENISRCKRLDHKHFKLAKPWFKSYDCGQFFGTVCRDFEPASWCKWLCEHWNGFDDYFKGEDFKGTIGICVDDDFSVRYYVKKIDFINGTFVDENGELKWVKKCYYKQSRSSPTGYILVHEERK